MVNLIERAEMESKIHFFCRFATSRLQSRKHDFLPLPCHYIPFEIDTFLKARHLAVTVPVSLLNNNQKTKKQSSTDYGGRKTLI